MRKEKKVVVEHTKFGTLIIKELHNMTSFRTGAFDSLKDHYSGGRLEWSEAAEVIEKADFDLIIQGTL